MRQMRNTPLIAALAMLAWAASSTAMAEQDSGSASQYPWSGYWWAHSDGGLTPPLAKYDKVFGTQAAGWEQANHVESANVQPWFGHCHAWSAASVTEKEPRAARTVKNVQFGVGDQKGLLTAVHAQDEATSYGDRFGDGRGSESSADVTPDEVWRLLQLYVRQKNIPLIFDLEAGDEVWNYPVYQYEVSYQDAGGGFVQGTMQLVAADDDVHPDYLGTQPGIYTYSFKCKMQGGSIVSGSGQWIGESQKDHPDFAWYPYVARAENPDIDPSKVSQIVGYDVGGGSNPGEDDGSDGSDEEENPTPEPPDEEGEPMPAETVDYDQILSPIELVSLISNKTSHFSLDIFVDKNDGGKYDIGEPIRAAAESSQAGYLYLFDVDPSGDLRLIFPAPGEPNLIPANTLVDVPAKDMESWFVAEQAGEHHLRGVVTTEPLALTGFHTQAQHKLKGKVKDKLKPEQGKERYEQGTQKLRLPPATQVRVKEKLKGYYSSKSVEGAPPLKLGKAFAQDDCLFFVVGKGDK